MIDPVNEKAPATTRGDEGKASQACQTDTTNAVVSQKLPYPEIGRLTELAKAEHKAACKCAKEAVVHARKAGEYLLEIKAGYGHGHWGLFLRRNFRGSDRTARNYMQLAANWHRIADLKPTSINAALMAAKELRPPRKPAAPPARPAPQTIDVESADITEPEILDQRTDDDLEVEIVEAEPPAPAPAPVEVESSVTDDPLPGILAMLPKLTQGQREELSQILVTRWNCKGKGAA